MGPFHIEFPHVIKRCFADWAFVFSHWTLLSRFGTFGIKTIAQSADIAHDRFAFKAILWINCKVQAMIIFDFRRTIATIADLGRFRRMTFHVFRFVRGIFAFLIAL